MEWVTYITRMKTPISGKAQNFMECTNRQWIMEQMFSSHYKEKTEIICKDDQETLRIWQTGKTMYRLDALDSIGISTENFSCLFSIAAEKITFPLQWSGLTDGRTDRNNELYSSLASKKTKYFLQRSNSGQEITRMSSSMRSDMSATITIIPRIRLDHKR